MTLKLKIMLNAVRIRVSHGEDLEVILASYPRLTAEEQKQIRETMQNENA